MGESKGASSKSFCKTCGYEIKWRMIDGKRTPLGGCACEYGEFGLSQFFRDRAVPTKCPICGESVYFVRHNGGSVWFDQLGDPWWKHACFDDAEEKPKAPIESYRFFTLTRVETTDLGQKIMFVSIGDDSLEIYPAPAFWKREPKPQIGDKLLVNWETLMLDFNDLTSCRFWMVSVSQCTFCEKYTLEYSNHKERCEIWKNLKSSGPGPLNMGRIRAAKA